MKLALPLLLSLCGCMGMLGGSLFNQNLTPEQVKAYQEVNADVYGCFTIGGPPPAGSTIWVIVPHGATVTFKVGDGCHLIQ